MKKWNTPNITELNISETSWNAANDPKPCIKGLNGGFCTNQGNNYKCEKCDLYKEYIASGNQGNNSSDNFS